MPSAFVNAKVGKPRRKGRKESILLESQFNQGPYKVVVEVKSVREITEIDCRQTLTHLKFSNTKLGLLINFNVLLLKRGVKRIVNNL